LVVAGVDCFFDSHHCDPLARSMLLKSDPAAQHARSRFGRQVFMKAEISPLHVLPPPPARREWVRGFVFRREQERGIVLRCRLCRD
jgi:hypothetical protein